MDLPVLPQNQVVRLIRGANQREVTLFVGAGGSVSSGVPSAGAMIKEWRRMVFDDRASDAERASLLAVGDAHAAEVVGNWCQEHPECTWFGKDDEYSLLFEELFPNPRERQRYVEQKVEPAFPGWGYLYLANIIKRGYFNVVFTTNFDDLVNDALAIYLGMNPVVCAADSQVSSISITSDRPKIIKLHGDYLFERLKNTTEELEQLDPNMQSKFAEFARECGMVVLGYAGRDRSIIRVLEQLLPDDAMFPSGIYWGVRREDDGTLQLAPSVQALRRRFDRRLRLFECQDFDGFMVRLHSELRLDLPPAIVRPFETLRKKYDRLLTQTTANRLDDETINEHIQALDRELRHPLAKATDAADFDLLQAELALGQRDYRKAIRYVARYVEQRPDDANALTTWGNALFVQGEEEDSEAAAREAAVKWKEAVARDPRYLPPRYSLARYYTRSQQTAEAIHECEELLKLAPHDRWLKRNLFGLYGTAGRYDEAQRAVNELLQQEPGSAEVHTMNATVLAQRGLIMEAVDAQRRAVALNPGNAWMRFSLGSLLAQIGRLDEAGAEFGEAIQLDPRNLRFRLQMANFYSLRQQPMLARPHLEAAVAIEPSSAEAHGFLGQVYLQLNQLAEARREMDSALALSPLDFRLLVVAGTLNLQLSRPDVAEDYFKRAAQLNPSAPQPYLGLCQLYLMSSRPSEFNAAFQALMGVDPTMAQQLQLQLQAMQLQYPGQPYDQQAALQAQWLAWLQRQAQAAPTQPWSPMQAGQHHPPSPTGA